MYIGIDKEPRSFRGYRDLMLLGGGEHRAGEHPKELAFEKLSSLSEKYFKGSRPLAFWSAQDCMTADNLAYIGRFSSAHPNWYVASGFGKWGMTNSAVSADVISDIITTGKSPYESLYSPTRFSKKAAKGIADEMGHAVKGLIRGNIYVPKEKLSRIKVGDGAVVNIDGKTVGVYRESENKHHTVIPRCTHMGCGLTFNPDEKSWDCPCHGSRFDYMGNVIDNPAKRNLKHPL